MSFSIVASNSRITSYNVCYTKLLRIILLNFFCVLVAHGQDYPIVKAQKGDGIYSILKRNGLSPGQYLTEFIDLNKEKLGKNNAVFIGRSYRLPVAAKVTDQAAVQVAEVREAGTAKAGKPTLTNKLYGSKYRNNFV